MHFIAMPGAKTTEQLQQAVALHQSGQLKEAEMRYRDILATDARNARAMAMLGLARLQQNCLQDGILLLSNSLAVNPAQPDVLNNLGNAQLLKGNYSKALACFEQAITLNPGYISAYFNRGVVLHDLQRYEAAVTSFKKAIDLSPGYVDAYLNIGNSLKELCRHEEAIASYDKALSLAPTRADLHYNRGMALQDLNQHEQAEASYDRAIRLSPGFADAYVNRASLFLLQGKIEEAEANLDTALKYDPDNVAAFCSLSTMGKCAKQDDRFKQLKSLHERREQLSLNDRIDLDFAVGKALESRKQFDEAFHAYDEANRLYHTAHEYDEAAENEWMNFVTSNLTAELFQQYEKTVPPAPADIDKRIPVFVVGMPRSGTTLIEQVLASHPAVFGAGELKTLQSIVQKIMPASADLRDVAASLPGLHKMGQEYLKATWHLSPDAQILSDKMPANYRYLGLIHLMLPGAKIIHAVRDPLDSCLSCYTTRFKELNDYSYHLDTLGRHYLRYQKLMRHWHTVLPPGKILDVRYEDIVADPEHEARRMLEYLGLPWNPACLKFYETKRTVQTASVVQVRKPIYSGSIGRWKQFEKHLEPLIKSLQSSQ